MQHLASRGGRFALPALAFVALTTVFGAPNPGTGTLSETQKVISYVGGPLAGANTGQCANNSAETFRLTTDMSLADFAGYNYKIEFTLGATPADLMFTVYNADGTVAVHQDGPGPQGAEFAQIGTKPGISQYNVVACSFAGATPDYSMRIELVKSQIGGGGGGPTACDNTTSFGGPDPTCVGVPRYQIFTPPDAAGYAHGTSGESNIGFNPATRRIMNENNFTVARVTPAEIKPDGSGDDSLMPEACPELWENVSSATPTTLDPILWTSQVAGRTISSNQTTGANGAYAYTDDDGDTWIDIGLGIPSGGVDHQTITTGPFPASMSVLGTPQNHGEFALFCSQNLVGSVCQRSLTLGTSWENSVPATGPGTSNPQGCGGLHGHAKIAPDGSAWLPDEGCSGKAGGGLSIDTSITPWTEFVVAGTNDLTGQPFSSSTPGQSSDPSIAFDDNNTVYYCYSNGEPNGSEVHIHMAVGRRTPGTTNVTWLRDTDLSVTHGIKNAVFPQAWGGSPGRAACGFLGTNKGGSFQTTSFNGDWYLFIATTYDEGRSFVVVNATPNDPVQHDEGVCLGGTGCTASTADRNLLDFNEVTADDKGRVLFSYGDGCVTPGCVARTSGHDGVADQRIARQIGGKTLFASQDAYTDTNDGVAATGPINPKPIAPKRPCLLDSKKKHPNPSTRDATAAHLFWRAPDNGGVPIVNYDVFRSETPADPSPVKIGTTANAKPQYDDLTVDPTVPFYYYTVKANTASLSSAPSNELPLEIGAGGGSPCVLPGALAVYDMLDNPDGTVADDDGGANTPPTPSVNAKWLNMAEPYLGPGTAQVVFTMQVGPDVAASPNSEWYIIWNRNTIAADGSDRAYVAMLTDAAGTPRFEYGNFGPALPIGGVPPPNANTPTPLGLADSGSYTVATGVVTITMSTSKLEGRVAGESLGGLNIRTFAGRYSGDPAAPRGQKSQNNASDITGNANYTLVGNLACRANTAPIVDTLEPDPAVGRSPQTVAFSGTAHDDDDDAPEDTIAAWHLDFGDGTTQTFSSAPAGVQHVYTSSQQEQIFNPSLTVTDSRGVTSVRAKFTALTLVNTPIAALTATPATVVKGSPVKLDASGSDAANDWTIDEFTFDAGDGSAAATVATSFVNHVYALGGSYTASVAVEDSQGYVSAEPATTVVEVTNTPPVAALIADGGGGTAPVTVSFDAAQSYDPDQAQTTDHVVNYRFDFGDGTFEMTTSPVVQHTYSIPGLYTVLVRVYDEENLPSAADAMAQVEAVGPPPTGENNHVTGAMPAGGLALLGLAALMRRRRSKAEGRKP